MICVGPNCDRAVEIPSARLCRKHYMRLRQSGTLLDPVKRTPLQRFWAFVDFTSSPIGCWLWTGGIDDHGYGQFGLTPKKNVKAHKFSADYLSGPCPPGMQRDHLCLVKRCVNPKHLECVTQQINQQRAAAARLMRGSSVAECRAHNPEVESSILSPATSI